MRTIKAARWRTQLRCPALAAGSAYRNQNSAQDYAGQRKKNEQDAKNDSARRFSDGRPDGSGYWWIRIHINFIGERGGRRIVFRSYAAKRDAANTRPRRRNIPAVCSLITEQERHFFTGHV